MVFRVLRSFRKRRQLAGAARSRNMAVFIRVWDDDVAADDAARAIIQGGPEFAKAVGASLADHAVGAGMRSRVAHALMRAVALDPSIALQALPPLLVAGHKPAYDLVSDGFFQGMSEAEAIMAEHGDRVTWLDTLLRGREFDRTYTVSLKRLEGVKIVGPAAHLPAWELIFQYLTMPHFRVRANLNRYEWDCIWEAERIVAAHDLPISVLEAWLDGIESRELRSSIEPRILEKVFGICEVLVRQHPNSMQTATALTRFVGRAFSLPGEKEKGFWPDDKVAEIIPLLERCSEPVALAGVTSILKQPPSKDLLLEAGENRQDVWNYSVLFGGDLNRFFRAAIDCLVAVCGGRAEGVLENVAKELGGTVRSDHREEVRKRSAMSRDTKKGGRGPDPRLLGP